MTTSADDNENDQIAPKATFMTPHGVFTDVTALPPMLRRMLEASLSAPDMDPEVRTVLAAALGVEAPGRTPPSAQPSGGERRDAIWDILDAAFPTEPHLWRAGEALLTSSGFGSDSPDADADARREAVGTAIAHLERHQSQNEPPLNPSDALVARFRDQMGDL